MPEAIPAVVEFFAADAGAATVAAGAGEAAAGGAAAGAGTAAAGAGAAAGGGLAGTVGTAVASAAASSLVGGLLQNSKGPNIPAPVTMPDPLAQDAARKKSLIEQLARRGRAASILTDAPGGKLGG